MSEENQNPVGAAQISIGDTPSTSVEPALPASSSIEAILLIPAPKKRKVASRTMNMPKHMTGDNCMSVMEAKKKEKEDKVKQKAQRKIEREEKKKENERLREEKAQAKEIEKEEKRKDRERMQAEKREEKRKEKEKKQEEKREEKRKAKERKQAEKARSKDEMTKLRAAKKTARKRTFHPPQCTSQCTPHTDATHQLPENCCIECGGYESDDSLEWVACDNCDRWCHVTCTYSNMSIKELETITWHCPACRV